MSIRKPYRRYLAVLLFFLLAGLVLLLADIIRKQRSILNSSSGEVARAAAAPDAPAIAGQVEMVLYFVPGGPLPSGRGILTEEKRLVARTGSTTDQARRLLDELKLGSRNGHQPVISPEAKMLHLFITKEGTAVINYHRALIDQHPGGVESEMATVYGIVNTLTRNFPEIASVRFLVEGVERETLVGHVDLSGDLKQDLSFVRGFEHSPLRIRVEPLPP